MNTNTTQPNTTQPNTAAQTPAVDPNAMMQMMNMMQMMQQGMMTINNVLPNVPTGTTATPFHDSMTVDEDDYGLDAEIVRPALLDDLLKTQEALSVNSVLDFLCLTEDAENSLGGLPKSCTTVLAGPPGKGKTRSALAALIYAARAGERVVLVVAEEGFHDCEATGRDDLCSRLVKLGMDLTELDEEEFKAEVLENIWIRQSQHHKGQTWDDFIARYRYLVEKEEITFVIIDSLNMLDPAHTRTADHLGALKTYNHERGVTCLCIGQVRDTGAPAGGEALMHTADAVFLIEEMSLGSKDIAAKWGGVYREKIDIIRAVKSVTTPIFPHPVRVERSELDGVLEMHPSQPTDMQPLDCL